MEVDLGGTHLFEEKDWSTLTVRAKMADLRAFADGRLDEKAMVGKIQVSES